MDIFWTAARLNMPAKYTPALLREFDRLTLALSSPNQMTRIDARVIKVPEFVAKHGEEMCDAMFEALLKRDRKRDAKP